MSEVPRDQFYGLESRVPDLRRNNRERSFNIKSLWQHSHEIINLAAQGFRQEVIAEILGLSSKTVSNTLNSELGMKKLSELRYSRDEEVKKTTAKIQVLTNKALKIYNEILSDESGECGMKEKGEVAKDILHNMSGLKVPTRIQSMSFTHQLSKEEIDDFTKRGVKAAVDAGMVIDIDESEID